MHLGTTVVGPPGPGELRLRVQACGLNPVDWKIAATGVDAWSWPHVPGLDIVGIVTDVGPGVDCSRIGELVAVHHDLTKPGGLAAAAVVSAAAAAVLPPGTDPVLAATAPCPGLTAWQAVDRTGVSTGDKVLVIGAAGGVGTFATQLAAEGLRAAKETPNVHHAAPGDQVDRGPETADGQPATCLTAVVGPSDEPRARELGATEVVDYRQGPLHTILSGHRFDVILDLVGSPATSDAGALLGYCGRLASVSRPDWGCPPFTTAPTLVELALGAVYSRGSEDDLRALATALASLVSELDCGRLKPPRHAVGSLADAPEMLQAMAEGTGPKAIIRIEEG